MNDHALFVVPPLMLINRPWSW